MEKIKFLVSNGPCFPRHPRGLDLPPTPALRLGRRPADPLHGPRWSAVGLETARLRVAAARREVEATPPEWAGFARRNAELAARLVSPAGSTGRNDRDGL
jgi:hypothetical protein